MLIRLEPQESSILTRIAQYAAQKDVPQERLQDLLEAVSELVPNSPTGALAKEVGRVLLGERSEGAVEEDIADTARYYREWAGKNRAYSKARTLTAASQY